MSQSLSQTFLAITRNSTDFEWLQGTLAPLGQVVSSAGESLDELLALVANGGYISKNVRQDVRRDDAVSFPSLIDRTGRAKFYRHRPAFAS